MLPSSFKWIVSQSVAHTDNKGVTIFPDSATCVLLHHKATTHRPYYSSDKYTCNKQWSPISTNLISNTYRETQFCYVAIHVTRRVPQEHYSFVFLRPRRLCEAAPYDVSCPLYNKTVPMYLFLCQCLSSLATINCNITLVGSPNCSSFLHKHHEVTIPNKDDAYYMYMQQILSISLPYMPATHRNNTDNESHTYKKTTNQPGCAAASLVPGIYGRGQQATLQLAPSLDRTCTQSRNKYQHWQGSHDSVGPLSSIG